MKDSTIFSTKMSKLLSRYFVSCMSVMWTDLVVQVGTVGNTALRIILNFDLCTRKGQNTIVVSNKQQAQKSYVA